MSALAVSNSPGGEPPELGFAHAFEPGTGPDTLLVLHATGGDEHQLMPLVPMRAWRSRRSHSGWSSSFVQKAMWWMTPAP